jgi:hypothetical protein
MPINDIKGIARLGQETHNLQIRHRQMKRGLTYEVGFIKPALR